MSISVVNAIDRQALAGLYRAGWDPPADVSARVAQILEDVRARGDAALVDLTRRFDDPSFDISKLRVPIPMFEQARSLVPLDIVEGLALARERVEQFHRRQLHGDVEYADGGLGISRPTHHAYPVGRVILNAPRRATSKIPTAD